MARIMLKSVTIRELSVRIDLRPILTYHCHWRRKEYIMKWRIHYNTCFYYDVVAESKDEAVKKVEKVLELEDVFRLNHAERLEDCSQPTNKLWH